MNLKPRSVKLSESTDSFWNRHVVNKASTIRYLQSGLVFPVELSWVLEYLLLKYLQIAILKSLASPEHYGSSAETNSLLQLHKVFLQLQNLKLITKMKYFWNFSTKISERCFQRFLFSTGYFSLKFEFSDRLVVSTFRCY